MLNFIILMLVSSPLNVKHFMKSERTRNSPTFTAGSWFAGVSINVPLLANAPVGPQCVVTSC